MKPNNLQYPTYYLYQIYAYTCLAIFLTPYYIAYLLPIMWSNLHKLDPRLNCVCVCMRKTNRKQIILLSRCIFSISSIRSLPLLNSLNNPSMKLHRRCQQNTVATLHLCCLQPELTSPLPYKSKLQLPDSVDESFTGASPHNCSRL